MSSFGAHPKFKWLPIDSLVIDERYQRRITRQGQKLIARITQNFKWSKFQPITVTGPDASEDYPVIDGQHRLEACRKAKEITEVPCWIVPEPELAEQAKTFVAINKGRVRVTNINVFWAAVTAHDPEAIRVKRICDSAGVAIGRIGTGAQPPMTTIAVAAIIKLCKLGDDVAIRALKIIAASQKESDNAFRSPVVIAMTRLLNLHGGVDEKRLISVLSELDFDTQIENARVYRKTFGGSIEAALQIVFIRAYNRGLGEAGRLTEKAG